MENTSDYARVAASTLSGGFAEKSLQIQIAADDLEMLKANDYQLCFAKYVSGGGSSYNVVWWATGQYLMMNTLSWVPQFELFGTNIFQQGAMVEVMTNITVIGLGEQCVLDEYGNMRPAQTGGPTDGITLINQYGIIHPGLCQLLTSPDGQQISVPTFVSESPIVMGQVTLTPVDKLLVWFQQNVQTSMMFSNQPSMSVEADLTMTNSVTLTYANQQWSTG